MTILHHQPCLHHTIQDDESSGGKSELGLRQNEELSLSSVDIDDGIKSGISEERQGNMTMDVSLSFTVLIFVSNM